MGPVLLQALSRIFKVRIRPMSAEIPGVPDGHHRRILGITGRQRGAAATLWFRRFSDLQNSENRPEIC
jgi:hypothetical protein